MRGPADDTFVSVAQATLDGMLERRPELATDLGDHRYDDRLTVGTAQYYEESIRWYGDRVGDLAAIDLARLSPQNRVDAQILANRLNLIRFNMRESREHEWNPLLANPGRAIYLLIARDFAPLPQRLRSLARRLTAVPEALQAARAVAGPMPKVHLETAISQFAGTARLIGAELDKVVMDPSPARGEVLSARLAAARAIDEHRQWLQQRLSDSGRDRDFREPRIGAERFARKLRLILDAESEAGEIVSRAESDLERVTAQISETAARLTGESPQRAGLVRRVLDSLAADAPDDTTILDVVRRAFDEQSQFVHEHDLVTTYDDDRVEVIEMPEIDRGVSVAYCDAPGPLEDGPGPTFVAVSPAPQDWSQERVRSFYREYNRHMVHNLMIHEGMPGHVVQLQHSRRFAGDTPVRAALRSGSFVEGWAVFAEQLMAEHRYPGEGNPDAVRMQQLKMQLRMIINTILDARVHCDGMTESEGMALMIGRGHQEEGEAAGKWRRTLLTSTQLSTYYVGFTEVADLATELRAANPEWPARQLHDTMLAHGSPAVRHLRTLLPRTD
ncbi:MAG TPA: DUF885 domain-containing protein [Streptosporangiaceae bacterium]|nr:DUF885 domain-containing protein [Streptosporangiaceae bacterium]